EPVDGKMPVTIACPKCGADTTDLANQATQQNLARSAAVSVAPVTSATPAMRLKVAHHAEPPAQSAQPTGGVSTPVAEMCSRHPRNPATEHCVVCGKAICPECMQTFGFLCSVNCRYRADQEGIKVPVYKFQRSNVERGENRKTLAIVTVVALLLFALAGTWIWYITSGSKPRPYYSLKLPPDNKSVYARFLG